MEFELKNGWLEYLSSGFFLGWFFMLLIILHNFSSVDGFPYNTYILVLLASFIIFIVMFIAGSYKSINTLRYNE